MRQRLHVSGRGLAERLLSLGEGLEISVLDTEAERAQGSSRARAALPWRDYLLAPLAAVLASGLALGLSQLLELPNISLIFLAAVLVVAVRSSLGPALLCAGLSFLAYNLLFIEPLLSLKIARQEDVLTLVFFLLMAALTGNLATRQRRQLQSLRRTQAETTALLELSRKLTAATDRQAVLSAAMQQFALWSDVEVSLLSRSQDGIWKVEAGVQRLLNEQERAAADWSWQHGQPAGLGSGTLPNGRWWWWPLAGEEGPLALLGIAPKDERPLSPERRRLIAALGQPLAQALERAQLAEDLEAARLHGQTEELRSALLASVSHDLRTPLTAMRGSIDSLLALGEQIPLSDRRELLEGTRDEAERLDRYIQNLLDMTRLGHGGLKLARDWVAPADIAASAVQRLRPGAGAAAAGTAGAATAAVALRARGADRAGAGQCAGERRAFLARSGAPAAGRGGRPGRAAYPRGRPGAGHSRGRTGKDLRYVLYRRQGRPRRAGHRPGAGDLPGHGWRPRWPGDGG